MEVRPSSSPSFRWPAFVITAISAEQVGEDWKAIVASLELEEELLPDDLQIRILDEGTLFAFPSADLIFGRVKPRRGGA